jgi:hypothetical protein
MQASSPGILPNIEYPPPPRVHWLVLVLAWWTLEILASWLAPKPYLNLLTSLIVDAWAFYLCMWIRSLDSDARSPFWCDVFVVVELAFAAMTIQQNPSVLHQSITGILGFASPFLGLATIYLIRADLLKHYNKREPVGLELGPVMTFFFSLLYFQSQLYPIAQFKKRQYQGIFQRPGRTLLP